MLAEKYGCESVAFPSISTGAYRFPKTLALQIATTVILDFLKTRDMTVYLVFFNRKDLQVRNRLLPEAERALRDAEYAQRARLAESTPKQRRPLKDSTEDNWLSFTLEKLSINSAPPPCEDAGSSESFSQAVSELLSRMDESFAQMLLRKIDEAGISDADCYRRANIDRRLFNKIKNDAGYRPGKMTVLAFAVSLRLSISETERMLKTAGFALSDSSKADVIVRCAIEHEFYEVSEINEVLFSYDQPLLGSGFVA